MTHHILTGDCIEAMAQMEASSIDAIVTDPPYGLEFMGKGWDGADGFRRSLNIADVGRDDVFGRASARAPEYRAGTLFQQWTQAWATEALRVLKPGGYLLAFGGTRTYHRLAAGLEDAGFEIRDMVEWLYGSGFPKSLDVSKAIDKAAGAEREIVGSKQVTRVLDPETLRVDNYTVGASASGGMIDVTAPATDEAREWQGWGTALKPAHEPVCVARKPLEGTVAGNVLAHGTGALNIDGCRIATSDVLGGGAYAETATDRPDNYKAWRFKRGDKGGAGEFVQPEGRWPANVVLSHDEGCRLVGERTVRGDQRNTGNGRRNGGFVDTGAASGDGEPNAPVYGDERVETWDCVPGCAVRLLDEQTGTLTSGSGALMRNGDKFRNAYGAFAGGDEPADVLYGDSGGASRFFYCAKASRAERNAGLAGFDEVLSSSMSGRRDADGMEAFKTDNDVTQRFTTARKNHHPTVKPIALMRWLCRLVTPPGGVILDPFMGSGTTGIAAALEGFEFVGIEREQEYVPLAEARLAFWEKHGERALEVVAAAEQADRVREAVAASGQMGLFG